MRWEKKTHEKLLLIDSEKYYCFIFRFMHLMCILADWFHSIQLNFINRNINKIRVDENVII